MDGGHDTRNGARPTRRELRRRLVALAVLALAAAAAGAEETAPRTFTVFWLDENYKPKVNLKPLEPLTPQVRAVLALYAMRAGTGCPAGTWEGSTYVMSCMLTTALGLGRQCSPEHIALVKTWFKDGIPPLNLSAQGIADARAGSLDKVCQNVPDTASYRTTLDVLRVRQDGNQLSVRAVISSTDGNSPRFETVYALLPDRVVVRGHQEFHR